MDPPAPEPSTLPLDPSTTADPIETAEFAFVIGALIGAAERAVRRPVDYPPDAEGCVCSRCDLQRALHRYNDVAVRQGRYWPAGPRVDT